MENQENREQKLFKYTQYRRNIVHVIREKLHIRKLEQ